jgi:hypothetical protein
MKVDFEYQQQIGMAGEVFTIAELLHIKGRVFEIHRYMIDMEV